MARFFSPSYGYRRDLHSFPTRRSSDLARSHDDQIVVPPLHLAQDRLSGRAAGVDGGDRDRKSTRLNSSHMSISYAVFCLKKNIMVSPVCQYSPEHGVANDRHFPHIYNL